MLRPLEKVWICAVIAGLTTIYNVVMYLHAHRPSSLFAAIVCAVSLCAIIVMIARWNRV